jgi:hypothetical protein
VNAREQARMVRKEAEFLDVCVPYQDKLSAAKEALQAAREGGDAEQIAAAARRRREAATEINEFRHWARTAGTPRDPGLGSAVIRLGG